MKNIINRNVFLKSKKWAMFCCLSLGLIYADAQEGNFILTVKMTNPPAGYKVYLYYKIGAKNSVDSGIYADGKFEIKGKTQQPQKATICLAPKTVGLQYDITKQHIFLYLENGKIDVVGDRELGNARVSGTPLNADYQSYLDMLATFKPISDSLSGLYGKARQKVDTAALKKLTADFDELNQRKRLAEKQFFLSHPNSLVSLDWLKGNVNIVNEKQQAVGLFEKLGKNLKNSAAGKEYAQLLAATQTVAIGDKAPDFTTKNVKGEDVAFSSFKGKYVLLDFWASWCGPCRKENPNVLKAYEAYKAKNFTVVSFSLDGYKDSWLHAVEKDALPWTQLSDLLANNSPIVNMYGVSAIPNNFLIDPSGKIIAKNLRGDDLETALAKALD